MDVGIIGAGRLGQAMAGPRCVPAARSCWPTAAARIVGVGGLDARRGSIGRHGGRGGRSRIVVIAVPWPRVPAAVQGLQWDGRIVIDATNDFDPSDLNGLTSSRVLADLVPGARVVKAANTLGAAVLGSDPHEAGGRRVIFLSGDDAEAKSEVSTLFEDAGFVAIDLGGFDNRRRDAAAWRSAVRRQPDPSSRPRLGHGSAHRTHAVRGADRLAIRELLDAYAGELARDVADRHGWLPTTAEHARSA